MIELRYDGRSIRPRSDESVLDALLRAGLDVRFSCRSGSCHVCMMRRAEGQAPASKGLTPELRELGYFLPCQCMAEESMALEPPRPQDFETTALVAEAERIGPDILRLRLETAREMNPRAGQHVEVVHPGGAVRPYSVASIPAQDYFLDLHVRRLDDGLVSKWLADEIQPGDEIRIRGPMGRFFEPESGFDGDRVLVGTGTGLAPLLPQLREFLDAPGAGSITVLHGARQVDELYEKDELERLAQDHPRLSVRLYCSRGPIAPGVLAGRVTDDPALMPDRPANTQIFVAGHPDMVDDVRARCRAAGVPGEQIHTDRFRHAYAPEAAPATDGREAPPPDPELWRALAEGTLLMEVLKDFYREVFADPWLGPFFKGVTRQRLVEKQFSFLRAVITGSRDYLGQRPRNAHHWMVVSDELFDYRLNIMRRHLQRHGLPEDMIARWHRFEEHYRTSVVKPAPRPRDVGGQLIDLEGFDEDVLDESTLCDGCGAPIERGTKVRYHRRLGNVMCPGCTGQDGAHEA